MKKLADNYGYRGTNDSLKNIEWDVITPKSIPVDPNQAKEVKSKLERNIEGIQIMGSGITDTTIAMYEEMEALKAKNQAMLNRLEIQVKRSEHMVKSFIKSERRRMLWFRIFMVLFITVIGTSYLIDKHIGGYFSHTFTSIRSHANEVRSV